MQAQSLKFNSQQKGYALFISPTTLDGSHLPFASQVYNQNNEVIGIVAQGSRICYEPLNP